jgi:hypothetical protein
MFSKGLLAQGEWIERKGGEKKLCQLMNSGRPAAACSAASPPPTSFSSVHRLGHAATMSSSQAVLTSLENSRQHPINAPTPANSRFPFSACVGFLCTPIQFIARHPYLLNSLHQ